MQDASARILRMRGGGKAIVRRTPGCAKVGIRRQSAFAWTMTCGGHGNLNRKGGRGFLIDRCPWPSQGNCIKSERHAPWTSPAVETAALQTKPAFAGSTASTRGSRDGLGMGVQPA